MKGDFAITTYKFAQYRPSFLFFSPMERRHYIVYNPAGTYTQAYSVRWFAWLHLLKECRGLNEKCLLERKYWLSYVYCIQRKCVVYGDGY